MKAVENAVSALDDAESFAAYLDELGRRHKARALKPTYLDVSGSYNLLNLFFCKISLIIIHSTYFYFSDGLKSSG